MTAYLTVDKATHRARQHARATTLSEDPWRIADEAAAFAAGVACNAMVMGDVSVASVWAQAHVQLVQARDLIALPAGAA